MSKTLEPVTVRTRNFGQSLVLTVRGCGQNFIEKYKGHAPQPRPKDIWSRGPKNRTRDVTNSKFWSNVGTSITNLWTKFQVHSSTPSQSPGTKRTQKGPNTEDLTFRAWPGPKNGPLAVLAMWNNLISYSNTLWEFQTLWSSQTVSSPNLLPAVGLKRTENTLTLATCHAKTGRGQNV